MTEPAFRVPDWRDWWAWARRELAPLLAEGPRRARVPPAAPSDAPPPLAAPPPEDPAMAPSAPLRFQPTAKGLAERRRIRTWVLAQPPGTRVTISAVVQAVPGCNRGQAWTVLQALVDEGLLDAVALPTRVAGRGRQTWRRR